LIRPLLQQASRRLEAFSRRSFLAGSGAAAIAGLLPRDLLVLNGNPLENIHLMEDPGKNLEVIMKDGKIHKNLL